MHPVRSSAPADGTNAAVEFTGLRPRPVGSSKITLHYLPPCAEGVMSGCVQVFGRRHDGLSTRRRGRRPKSAKARNRGKWSTERCIKLYADLIVARELKAIF
jgi:hypothetical protein